MGYSRALRESDWRPSHQGETQLTGRYHRHWASPCFTVNLEDMPPLLGFAIMTLACFHVTQVDHTPAIS